MGGVVVNADAIQVYDVLKVLTARPAGALAVPHLLYGHVDPAIRYSTGAWRDDVAGLLARPDLASKPFVIVGGTGLYFDALIHGFADVPKVPPEVVARIESLVAPLDAEGRGRLIAERDPEMAARLAAPDPQRVVRALAVLEATGRSLARFQSQMDRGLLEGARVERIVISPPRDVVAERIDRRFRAMLEQGAIEEVEALRALELDPGLPAMKAIGVPEISAWLDGRIDRETMIERAVIASRQYAKRQRTWLRGRMGDWSWRTGLGERDEGGA